MTRLMLTKDPAGSGRSRQEVANSGVTSPPRHHEAKSFLDGLFSALVWLSSTSGRLRGSYARSGHGTAPRGATRARLPRAGGSGDRGDRSSAGTRRSNHQDVSLDPTGDKARAVKARTAESVAAAGRPPRHGTARATPTRIANAAIPARLHRNGRGTGSRSDARLASALRRGAVFRDWSRTHARRRGGDALKRLQAGEWPAPSTVIDLYGAWAAAVADAFDGA